MKKKNCSCKPFSSLLREHSLHLHRTPPLHHYYLTHNEKKEKNKTINHTRATGFIAQMPQTHKHLLKGMIKEI